MKHLVDSIRPGDRVTIVDRFGKQRTGRAVMRGPHGWVLNMGGRHGTPSIASDRNVVKVKGGRGNQFGRAVRVRCEVYATPKRRAKRLEYAGGFSSCAEAKDYAEWLKQHGHKARVKRK